MNTQYQVQYPTVEELATMTSQQVFDRVVVHLIKQGKRAVSGHYCQYRSDDGTACAVGAVIPQALYSRKMEGVGVRGLWDRLESYELASFVRAHQVLLGDLQNVHDEDRNLPHWPRYLERIARHHALSPHALYRALFETLRGRSWEDYVKEQADSSRPYSLTSGSIAGTKASIFIMDELASMPVGGVPPKAWGTVKAWDKFKEYLDGPQQVEPKAVLTTTEEVTETVEQEYNVATRKVHSVLHEVTTSTVDGVDLKLSLDEARALNTVMLKVGGDNHSLASAIEGVRRALAGTGVGHYVGGDGTINGLLEERTALIFTEQKAYPVALANESVPAPSTVKHEIAEVITPVPRWMPSGLFTASLIH